MTAIIAFQGEFGAYSHQACRKAIADHAALPCSTFEDAVDSVLDGIADYAILPVENSIYGRVADIHRLLPESQLSIVDEVFIRVRINVLAKPGTEFAQIRTAMSHTVLLGQCRKFLTEHRIRPHAWSDTAGAAEFVANGDDPTVAALASELAGRVYGLVPLKQAIEDEIHNRTRFLIMAPERDSRRRSEAMLTSFVFRVRNIPAALYKAMGGFATNHVNMVKLESYMVGGSFNATQFFADVEGHPEDENVRLAMEELEYFSDYVRILGVYPAAADRNVYADDDCSGLTAPNG